MLNTANKKMCYNILTFPHMMNRYRKIAGDVCTGGEEKLFQRFEAPCCGDDTLPPFFPPPNQPGGLIEESYSRYAVLRLCPAGPALCNKHDRQYGKLSGLSAVLNLVYV